METTNIESTVTREDDKLVQAKKTRQKRLKKVVFSLLGISIFFVLTTVYFGYETYALKKLAMQEELTHPDVPVTPEQILEAVSHHMILPDVVPSIAMVQDAVKLSASQEFFKDVKNGDAVIVYPTMIIVFRPSADIIVAVGNVSGSQK